MSSENAEALALSTVRSLSSVSLSSPLLIMVKVISLSDKALIPPKSTSAPEAEVVTAPLANGYPEYLWRLGFAKCDLQI